MEYSKIFQKIKKDIKKSPQEFQLYQDYFDLLREYKKEAYKEAQEENHIFRPYIVVGLNEAVRKEDYKLAQKFDDLLFKSLLFGAQDYFDDYLQAVEYGKPNDKKFYMPRRHYLKRYVDAYQRVLDGELDFLSISMPKRAGKAVTLDTLIPTPFGFKRMGDIKVGDLVMARDGYDTKVTDVFPQGKVPVFEVEFDSGYKVKTCANHLWKVKVHDWNKHSGGYYETVLSTGDMLKTGLKSNGKNSHNIYSVEYSEPAEFIYKEVKLDPYVLGVLLGDGCLTDSCIMLTSFDHEVTDYVKDHLPEGDMLYCQDAERGRYIIKSKERRFDEKGHLLKSKTCEILEELGCFGKKAWEKSIPESYIYTTSIMREELLKGLLDTDGYSSSKDIEFSTTSHDMAKQVMFITRSLGGKATVSERMGKYKKNGEIIETRINYRVHLYFNSSFEPPFRIERKINAYKPQRDKLYHRIVSIAPCGEEEAQCIRVDNEEHLFLIGEYFVPTHNSQLGINFVNMLSGKHPDRSTLMEGTGRDLVKSFYKGCLEYMEKGSEYHYYDIFPEITSKSTQADTMSINLNGENRFPTIMCRSIDSTQVGLSEATNVLYLDDCVEGREESKNRQRLDDKWEVISGDIIGRAIEGTPIVICGTRYSLYDPIGRLQEEMRKQGKRMCILETPALDLATDESNFEYEREGHKVFTTKYFRDQREMLSAEQFESEFQQQPFEAKGLLFPKDSLNYYFELPIDKDPDSIIAVCDTADTGSDSCSMPIAYIYGDEVYIEDVVFDDSPPNITKPECAKALMDNKVSAATFESNNAGSYFARDVNELIGQRGGVCAIRTKRTISNKQTRIEFASDNIIKHFYFKDPSIVKIGSQYHNFMKETTTYTRSGKVPHDDAPDSLSLLENELRMLIGNKIEVFTRPF